MAFHPRPLLRGILPLLFLCLLSCSHSQKGHAPGPDPQLGTGFEGVSKKEIAEFQAAQGFLTGQAPDKALKKLAGFEKRFPNSLLLSQVQNLRGLSQLALKHFTQSSAHFEQAILLADQNNFSTLKPYLQYNLATSYFEQGKSEQTLSTLRQIPIEHLNLENQTKYFFLLSKVKLQKNMFPDGLQAALEGERRSNLAATPKRAGSTPFTALIEQGARSTGLEDLQLAFDEYKDQTDIEPVLFYLARKEAQAGKTEDARAHFDAYLTRFPQGPHRAEAASLYATLGGSTGFAHLNSDPGLSGQSYPLNPRRVGVLLPLTGKLARFGLKTLQGIELAFGYLGNSASGERSPIQLFIEDTGDETETAVAALERLVKRDQVVAVIGPLATKGIDRVTQAADNLRVPLLSLARSPGVLSPWVIQGGLSAKVQAHAMAEFAIKQKGLKRFAILYPSDKMGQIFANQFWTSVNALGGEIRGFESYAPGETDFRQSIDKLSGLFYTEARRAELFSLAKERDTNKITKRTRRTENYFSLRPIVDFDAVYIPEEPKLLPQILPTFAYRDVDKMTFLGTASWNTQEFLDRAQNNAEGAFFLDAFASESNDPRISDFLDQFKRAFHQTATSLEALSYDAAGILNQVLKTLGNTTYSRSDVSEQLRRIRNYPGVTGNIEFRDDAFFRNLKILTVKNSKIISVD